MKLGGYDYQQYKNITGIQIVQYQFSIKKQKLLIKLFENFSHYYFFQAFNYEITNAAIDYYFVDMTVSNYCSERTKHYTINPIQPKNSALLTLVLKFNAILPRI